jgi:replicative DNA helicase
MDDLYIQYVPGHIWTIGAYTSVGKTAVMTQKLRNLLHSNKNPRIVIISTEMTEEQMIGRIIANFTAIPSVKILSGNLTGPEEIEVAKCEKFIATKNLTVYDDVYTLGEIETVFRKAELKGGVDIGFIDYVQNCQVPEAKSEYQEQSTLAKRIQKLAKDVRATIVCLSQVSNDVGRGNTNNLELKGAGEWAAVSDVGVMLYRGKENKYMMKYSIKKNRHGQLHDEAFLYTNNWTRLEAQGKTEE